LNNEGKCTFEIFPKLVNFPTDPSKKGLKKAPKPEFEGFWVVGYLSPILLFGPPQFGGLLIGSLDAVGSIYVVAIGVIRSRAIAHSLGIFTV
jgi:hypothetical protein